MLEEFQPRHRFEANAIKSLANTLFKKLNLPEAKKQSPLFRLGIGVWSIMAIRRSVEADPATVEGDSPFALLANLLPKLPEFNNEMPENIMRMIGEASQTIYSRSPSLPQAEFTEFMGGFMYGRQALPTGGASLEDRPDATKIAFLLILLRDYGECFHSVEELERFVREGTRLNLSGNSESFKKHCQRLGFRGGRYLRSKRKRKLGDKAKMRVQ
jgi:hypothetical protein